jgi:hypothetical protein
MKKSSIAALMLCLTMGTASNLMAKEVKNDKVITATNKAETSRLMNRLYEIKSMDKSQLTRADKKELRKEVLGIKHQLQASDPYIYISLGAALLIALILILLL